MRPLGVVFGLVVAVGALSTTVWWGRHASGIHQRAAAADSTDRRLPEVKETADRQTGVEQAQPASNAVDLTPTIEPRPPIADGPPFPKVVTGDRVYEFGHMAINEEKKHTFRIENKGEAPLVLAKGPTECKCTISGLSKHEVPPGGSADVEIDWTPRAADPTFEKSAIIWTNDPKLSVLNFRVEGQVIPLLTVSPLAWHAGPVTEDQDGKAVGTIASEREADFKIVSVEPSDPNVRVDYRPLSSSELTRTKMRSGYEFTVTVAKAIRLGRFRSQVKIVTTLAGQKTVDVEVTALRSGPIRFLPAVPLVGSAYWIPDKSLLNMGRFRHENGSKTALPALVYAMKDKFQLLGVKSSDGFVKVSLEPNPAISNGAQQGVRFVFEVPPGSPPVNYMTRKPVHVTVNTNHPQLKDLDFDLQFVSR